MNKLLYMAVKRYHKELGEENIKKVVAELQKQFNVGDKADCMEIEYKITDKDVNEITKKYDSTTQ